MFSYWLWMLGSRWCSIWSISENTSKKVLDKSFDKGLNFYDTSVIGFGDDGRSEKILGSVLKKEIR